MTLFSCHIGSKTRSNIKTSSIFEFNSLRASIWYLASYALNQYCFGDGIDGNRAMCLNCTVVVKIEG